MRGLTCARTLAVAGLLGLAAAAHYGVIGEALRVRTEPFQALAYACAAWAMSAAAAYRWLGVTRRRNLLVALDLSGDVLFWAIVQLLFPLASDLAWALLPVLVLVAGASSGRTAATVVALVAIVCQGTIELLCGFGSGWPHAVEIGRLAGQSAILVAAALPAWCWGGRHSIAATRDEGSSAVALLLLLTAVGAGLAMLATRNVAWLYLTACLPVLLSQVVARGSVPRKEVFLGVAWLLSVGIACAGAATWCVFEIVTDRRLENVVPGLSQLVGAAWLHVLWWGAWFAAIYIGLEALEGALRRPFWGKPREQMGNRDR